MSLILRKGCQDVLDENGMGQFHVDISDGKCLRLVTECGKPLVHIHGIKFNRMVPSEAEIQYAVELFDSFFAKHKNLLQEYIKQHEEYKKQEPKTREGWHVRFYKNSYSENREVAELEYKEGFFEHQVWKFLDTGEISVRTSMVRKQDLPSDFSLESLDKVKTDKKLFAEVVKYIEEQLANKQRKEKLDETLALVSACDI